MLNVDRRKPPEVVGKAKVMDVATVNNAAEFLAPLPTNAAFEGQITITDKAITAATKAGPAATAARNVQVGILMGMMETRCTYVQGIADTAATPDQAAATIRAAALDVAGVGERVKEPLTVTQSVPGGPVTLVAYAKLFLGNSRRGRVWGWQYSGDGGKTWTNAPSTSKARTILMGLTPLTLYAFRANITLSSGLAGAWSPTVELVVR